MVRNSVVYLASSVVGKALPFLMLPILTNYMAPAEFGLVAMFQLGIQVSVALAGLSINVNIPRFYFSNSKSAVAELIFNSYAVLATSSAILLFAAVVLASSDTNVLGLPSGWVVFLPLVAFMSMSHLVRLTLLRTMERPFAFMRQEIGLALLVAGLTLVFVIFLNYSWKGQAAALALSTVLFGTFAMVQLKRERFLIVDRAFVWTRRILTTCIPLIPHAIAGVVISVSDRLFIERLVGIEAVGIYTIGYYFGMVVMLFSDAFVKAWNPWFFKKMASPDASARKAVVRYTYLFIAALAAGAFVYANLAVVLLPYVVSEAYLGAAQYIPWVCAGYVFFGVYQVFFPYLVYAGKTVHVAIGTVVAAALNLIGNYYLISAFGPIGAAYSTVASFAVSACIIAYLSQRFVPMPWLR